MADRERNSDLKQLERLELFIREWASICAEATREPSPDQCLRLLGIVEFFVFESKRIGFSLDEELLSEVINDLAAFADGDPRARSKTMRSLLLMRASMELGKLRSFATMKAMGPLRDAHEDQPAHKCGSPVHDAEAEPRPLKPIRCNQADLLRFDYLEPHRTGYVKKQLDKGRLTIAEKKGRYWLVAFADPDEHERFKGSLL